MKFNPLSDEAQAKLDAMSLTGFSVKTHYEGERHWSIIVKPDQSYANRSFSEVWFDGDTEEDCIDQGFDYFLGLLDYAKTN